MRFSPGVALAQKRAIIDSIGVLEGGHLYMGSIYIVRIPGDGSAGPLSRALEYARGRPQVQSIAQACYDKMEQAERDSLPVERLQYTAGIAALRTLPPPPDTARLARAFFMQFDSTGSPDVVRAAFPFVSDSTFAARGSDVLRTTLRVGPPVQPFDVMLVVNTGPNASVAQGTFIGRMPRVLNQARVASQLRLAARELPERDTLLFGRQFTVHVRLIANLDGTASAASVARSSGVPAVDSAALDVASAYRFAPGEVQGAPIAMWVVAPLTFRFQPETEAARRRRLRRQATSSSPPD